MDRCDIQESRPSWLKSPDDIEGLYLKKRQLRVALGYRMGNTIPWATEQYGNGKTIPMPIGSLDSYDNCLATRILQHPSCSQSAPDNLFYVGLRPLDIFIAHSAMTFDIYFVQDVHQRRGSQHYVLQRGKGLSAPTVSLICMDINRKWLAVL